MIREWLRRIREFPTLERNFFDEHAKRLDAEVKLLKIKESVKPVGGVDSVPTQRDKSSPSSHFSVEELLAKKRKQWPAGNGYFVLTLQNTNSMEWLVDDNSVVVCEDLRTPEGQEFIKKAPLRIGDICGYYTKSFGSSATLILHQVVEIDKKNKLYKFRGTNNWASDSGLVREEDILLRAFEFCSGQQKRVGD